MSFRRWKTLAETLELKRKVREYRTKNIDLTQAHVSARFGITEERFRRLLTDEIPYPARYKQAAARLRKYGLSIEEVAENYEAGKRYCKACEAWKTQKEFNRVGSETLKHRSIYCGQIEAGNDRKS